MASLSIYTGIVNYPGAMLSAVYGLNELFELANVICKNRGIAKRFVLEQLELDDICGTGTRDHSKMQIIVIPPALNNVYYSTPDEALKDWILARHAEGTLVCSVCAGAFILAATGILKQRRVTTHWNMASSLARQYPDVKLDADKILINDGDIITAGGLMSWVDLGLELVKQFTHSYVMRELGKQLVVDTGTREQSYYQVFTPRQDHGDKAIVKAQHYIQEHLSELITIAQLSEHCVLSERTFLRRFLKATSFKPTEYIQRLRIQHACDLIETSNLTLESISIKVGYQDVGAFRKMFIKLIKLTPKAFRAKFSQQGHYPTFEPLANT